MTAKRIFVTGASGCIGHYLAEALIQETEYELYFLVRNPQKLGFNYHARPGINILHGDLRDIEKYADILKTVDQAVLIATAWGDPQETFDINVTKTLELINLLNPESCEQVIYFSTASILDRNNQLLKEAGEIGTDYIKTKYQCYSRLSELEIAPKITTVFPTLVLGGEANKPYSHLSSGIGEVTKWVGLLRFFKIDGSFQFIHAKDIAQVVKHLIIYPPELSSSRQFILGNQEVTANQLIEELAAYFRKKIYFRLPVTQWFTNLIIVLFKIQMADWDRFCMNYRYFSYKNPTNPSTFGVPTYCPTLKDVFKISEI